MKELNIRHFKLTSGEEVIGLVQHSDENAFVLERPVQIKMNNLGMYMYSPWFPFSDKKIFKLFKRHVINHVEIEEDSKKQYINYNVGEKKDLTSFNELVEKIADEYQASMEYEDYEPAEDIDPTPKETIH